MRLTSTLHIVSAFHRPIFYRLISALLLLGAMPCAIQPMVAQHKVTEITPNKKWRIDEPVVTEREVEYNGKIPGFPLIEFQPGDTVIINAGGCVQTRGGGKTWKRYVDPQGPNSDRLYYGLIWVPGATQGLQPLNGILNTPRKVKTTCVSPQGNYLRLGYEDDDYNDNGYQDRDDGTGDQCKGLPNAWLEIEIVRSDEDEKNEILDLVWSSCDWNGIPLNPQWYYQVVNPGKLPDPYQICNGFPLIGPLKDRTPFVHIQFPTPPPISQMPMIDLAAFPNSIACNLTKPGFPILFRGHLNWGCSTYMGRLYWGEHAPLDDDYNLRLRVPKEPGLTALNNGTLLLEFDSDETIDHFKSPWWEQFHAAVDQNDTEAAKLINDKLAIVTGLFGLDIVHEAYSESHPVWALVVCVSDSPKDERWAFFARNWGNEGGCSQDQHYLDLFKNIYSFQIPWRDGATNVKLKDMLALANKPNLKWSTRELPGKEGLLVSCFLEKPEAGSMFHGEFRLEWEGALESQRSEFDLPQGLLPTNPNVKNADEDEDEDEAERLFEKWLELLPAAQKSAFDSNIDALKMLTAQPDFPAIKLEFIDEQSRETLDGFNHPRLMARPPVRQAFDRVKAVRDYYRMKTLREAFGGKLPGE